MASEDSCGVLQQISTQTSNRLMMQVLYLLLQVALELPYRLSPSLLSTFERNGTRSLHKKEVNMWWYNTESCCGNRQWFILFYYPTFSIALSNRKFPELVGENVVVLDIDWQFVDLYGFESSLVLQCGLDN